MARFLVGLGLAALCTLAHAEGFSFIWVTYAQWERLPEAQRVYYLGGAFDSLSGFAGTDAEEKVAVHFSKCMSESGMTLRQFTAHVASYAETRPDLQGGTMQGVMINYLIALCGKVPQ